MRGTTRLSVLLSCIAALVLPGSATAAAAPPGQTHPVPRLAPGGGTPTIAWEPCPHNATADCGTLELPVDWAAPDGPTFQLAVARRRATDPAARLGSLIVNPGGPGQPGTGFALNGARFSAELTRRFDIVGFDPRGVGRSNPVLCSAQLLAEGSRAVPTSQPEFDRLAAFNGRLAADCRARTGPLFDHLDTVSVAHDIEAIRQAVGDQALSFYGLSYGTLMGQQYAELFPDRVRAIALDSNMDHSVAIEGFLDTQASTAQDSFNEFVIGCQRDRRCAMHGLDIHTIWRDLLARARRGELHDPGDASARISELALINMAFGSFYRPSWWELANNINRLHTNSPPRPPASGGPPSPAAPGAGEAPTWRLPAAGGPGPEAVPYAFTPIFCQDWSVPVRDYAQLAGHLTRMAALAPDMPFSPLAVGAVTGCVGWPARVNNPQHPVRVGPNSRTLLLVNAAHDPATGHQWASNAAEQLGPRGVLVTYEGWGHAVYGREACTTGIVDRYLVYGTVPAEGTRCPAAAVQAGPSRTAPAVPTGPQQNIPGWSPRFIAGPDGIVDESKMFWGR